MWFGPLQPLGDPELTSPAEVGFVTQIVAKAFPRCRPATAYALVGLADVRAFSAGQTVVAQGDARRTVLVLEGYVGLRRTTLDGREFIPRIVSAGQLASLLAIAGRPPAAEAVAMSPCRVALWAGGDLQALAAGDAGLALDLLDRVLDAFEAVFERLDGFVYQNAMGRVARVLEHHAALFFGDTAVLTRAYLPALVGTSREMTGRVLRRLESHGVVARIGRDRLELLDAERLAQTAASGLTAREGVSRNKFLVKPSRGMRH